MWIALRGAPRHRSIAPAIEHTANLHPNPLTPSTKQHQVFLADGSGLSGVSAAVRLSPTPQGSQDRYLLGSWSDRGVLLCTKQAASEEGGGGGKEGEL